MTTGRAGADRGGTLPARLDIEPGMRLALLHAPEGIEATLGPLPDGVELQHGLRRTDRVDVIVGFVTERAHLERNIGWLVGTLSAGGVFWVARPDGPSTVPTDLTDHVIREVAGPLGWALTRTCSIDGTWTGSKLVRRAPGGGVVDLGDEPRRA